MNPIEGGLRSAIATRWGVEEELLPPDTRELFDVHEMLYGLFRDPAVEQRWLREDSADLGGQPLNMILAGGDALTQVVTLLEFACGRI